MKKTKLTRSLLAACSIVALSAVMYGCVHSGGPSQSELDAAEAAAAAAAEAQAAAEAEAAAAAEAQAAAEAEAAAAAAEAEAAAAAAAAEAEAAAAAAAAEAEAAAAAAAAEAEAAAAAAAEAQEELDARDAAAASATAKALKAAIGSAPLAHLEPLTDQQPAADLGPMVPSLTPTGLMLGRPAVNLDTGAYHTVRTAATDLTADPRILGASRTPRMAPGESAGMLGAWDGTDYAHTSSLTGVSNSARAYPVADVAGVAGWFNAAAGTNAAVAGAFGAACTTGTMCAK